MEQYDVVVIGAGLVGAAVAYELSRAGASTLVVEKGPDIAAGASRSNSGLLCTGFDAVPNSVEATMIRYQGERWTTVFDELGIPYRIPGALVLARDASQVASLDELAENARCVGVSTEILSAGQVRKLEPGVLAEAGLLIPGEAITDPYEVVYGLLQSGPEVRTNWPVARVEQSEGVVDVSGPAGKVTSAFVVNCAGLYADEVAGDDSFRISPRRGEFLVFEPGTASLVNHILLPVPDQRTKGVLVFPTIHGHMCAGPTAVDQIDKEDWRPRQDGLDRVSQEAAELFPPLTGLTPVGSWAGLRPVGHPHGYIIDWSVRVPALLNIAGIRSTGLSSCLGLARLALDRLKDRGLELKPSGAQRRFRSSSAPNEATGAARNRSPLQPWWERHNQLH